MYNFLYIIIIFNVIEKYNKTTWKIIFLLYFQVSWIKFKMPLNTNKSSISECMSITMNNRRKWIMENAVSINEIFDEFPRLSDYSGEMVNNNILSLGLLCIGKDISIFLRIFFLNSTLWLVNECHLIVQYNIFFN